MQLDWQCNLEKSVWSSYFAFDVIQSPQNLCANKGRIATNIFSFLFRQLQSLVVL